MPTHYAFTPYATAQQALAYNGLNLANMSGDSITELLNTATAMMDGYLGQSLMANTYTDTVKAVPATSEWGFGGFFMNLPRRFVQNVQNLTIYYGYTNQALVMESGDFYLDSNLGTITTIYGNYTQGLEMFGTTFDTQVSNAVVTYTAGFDPYGSGTLNEIPGEVMQAYWQIVRDIKGRFDLDLTNASGISGDNFSLIPASNRVASYKLTTEQVFFDGADPRFQSQINEVVTGWVAGILNKYRYANLTTGGMANL